MSTVIVIDPLLDPAEMEAMIDLWHQFPVYTPTGQGSYRKAIRNSPVPTPLPPVPRSSPTPPRMPSRRFAPKIVVRADARRNFLRTGGRFGRKDDPLLAARHKYFRETYASGSQIFAPGIEVLLNHPRLLESARKLYGRDIVIPTTAYANLMLPGQELGLHTDTPAFRGVDRSVLPNWLLIAMHLSGLFTSWHLPIATAVSYIGESNGGGEFACYPDGPSGKAAVYPALYNTAVMLDTDSIFHGVDRLKGDDPSISWIGKGTQLVHDGNHRWSLRCVTPRGLETISTYSSDELRCSVSWKAFCFTDDEEREAWTSHRDDLSLEMILSLFVSSTLR